MYCPVCGAEVDDQLALVKHTQKVHTEEELNRFYQKNSPQVQMPTEIIRGENFYKIYATDWAINVTEFDLRIEILNEERVLPAGIKHRLPVAQYISESQIIANPIAAKRLVKRLSDAIEQFEKNSVNIPMRD